MAWETVIGLEVHIQLATQSKIFSTAPTAYGAEPNTQASAVDIALPGMLPVINANVIRMATLFGLAIDADIAQKRQRRIKAARVRIKRIINNDPGIFTVWFDLQTVRNLRRAFKRIDHGRRLNTKCHGGCKSQRDIFPVMQAK